LNESLGGSTAGNSGIRWLPFPIAVAKKFTDDQGGNLVSLLAYYSFVATFPLLLALTAVAGVVLRAHPKLQEQLVKSAFAEFPIVGGQIH
jgi:membrane protein